MPYLTLKVTKQGQLALFSDNKTITSLSWDAFFEAFKQFSTIARPHRRPPRLFKVSRAYYVARTVKCRHACSNPTL
jgi:hypothetical protein